LILMGDGNRKKIKDIKIDDYVISVNKYNVTEPKKVKNIFNNGIQRTYKINTQHNNYIIGTEDHKVLTQDGWKKIIDLTTNDWIMTPKKINSLKDNIHPKYKLSEKTMYLIGLLIGDGSIGNINTIHFTNSEEVLINKFKECVNQLSRSIKTCEYNIVQQNGVTVDYIYSIYIKTKEYENQIKDILQKYNLNCFAGEKKIPDELMMYPIGGKLTHLIAGLFNTDGGYNLGNNTIEYYTKSKNLAYQIKSLLMRYNIYSYVEEKKVKGYNYNSYTLMIRQKDSLLQFGEKIIPYIVGRKKNDYINIINNISSLKYNYMMPQKYYDEIIVSTNEFKLSFSDIGKQIGGYKYNGFKLNKNSDITDIKAKNITQHTYCPLTYELLMSEYFPLKIIDIAEYEICHVYDIEVEDNHNYIANELIVHNCIGKKDVEGLNQQLPKILEGYCSVSKQPREVAEEEAKEFIQIISDSSEYQFGYNHSTGYSMDGYACVRLRTYYPLEFITAYLNNADNKEDIQMGTELARERNIKIKPIEFGQSIDKYTFDKATNTIYKGIESIKFCNAQIAYELYELRNNKYNTFAELLKDIVEKTSVNSRHLMILTGLGFFRKYGKNKKLLNYIDIFSNFNGRKQIKKSELEKLGLTEELIKKYSNKETEALYKDLDTTGLITELTNKIEDTSLSVKEQVKFEKDYLEYVIYTNPKVNEKFYIVIEYTTYNDKRKPYVTLKHIQTGDEIKTKIKEPQVFVENPFKLYDVLKVIEWKQQYKTKNIGGKWQKTNELEDILYSYEVY